MAKRAARKKPLKLVPYDKKWRGRVQFVLEHARKMQEADQIAGLVIVVMRRGGDVEYLRAAVSNADLSWAGQSLIFEAHTGGDHWKPLDGAS